MKQFIMVLLVVAFTGVISGQDDDLVVEESIDETNEPTCDGQFEVYNACGSATDPSCESQSRRIRVTNSRCFSRCFCIDGYVRNSTNSCVPLSQCPVRSCLDTEDYSECGPSCDITCENYLVKDEILAGCDTPCYAGCFCKLGLVHDYSGKCVATKQCKHRS